MIRELGYKPDFGKTVERFEAWWRNEVIDRPPVTLSVNPHQPYRGPVSAHTCLHDRWLDVEWVVESSIAWMEAIDYLGDSFPIFQPNIGPEISSTLFGCELTFTETTSWSTPVIKTLKDWERIIETPPDFENPYWQAVERMTDYAIECSNGRYIVGITDLHGNYDILAALRDPMHLATDLLDDPELVKQAGHHVSSAFIEAFERLYGKVFRAGMGSTTWLATYHEGPMYVPSCDYWCMVSPDMAREIILPDILFEMQPLERSIFHLDGVTALKHLDLVLSIPHLNGVQWVYGAGQGPAARWIETYRRIREAGKCLQVLAYDAHDALAVLESLGPEGVWLTIEVPFQTVEEAQRFLKEVEGAQGKKRTFSIERDTRIWMNDRERFRATMHFRHCDRSPICDFGFWDETLIVWKQQGLPDWVNQSSVGGFFGMDCYDGWAGLNVELAPWFECKVIEDLGDHEILQQGDGVRVLRRKFMSSIPQPQAHLLTDRQSWRTHYKPRLDPATPSRYPEKWEDWVRLWKDENREYPITLPGGSLYGWIRNWMGVEQVSYVVYDDPAWFEEMVETIADCVIGTLSRALETGGQFEACGMWEDMCYSSGPLLSPHHFKKFLIPHYRRITSLLHRYGVDVIWVDCDGKIDSLIPHWMEAGVNCMFPIEVGVWKADVVEYRKQYGKDLLLMGGFDKHILARSEQEIEREVYRLLPLIEEGGYIGFCDHRVPPDVPFENYLFYLDTVRRVWGRGINLKPMGIEFKGQFVPEEQRLTPRSIPS